MSAVSEGSGRVAEVAAEVLVVDPTTVQLMMARRLVEGCPYSTTALRALIAVLVELGQADEAELLRAVLPWFATIEAGSL